MRIARPNDYTPGRPINTLGDAYLEMQRIATFIRDAIHYRGLFDSGSVGRMSPAPRAGDYWIVQDPGGDKLYIQLSVKPRVRIAIDGVIERA